MLMETILAGITMALVLLYMTWFVILFFPAGKHRKDFYPDISVIIPAYNEEENIQETIESVVSAGYPKKFEILVVDDGSTDSTSRIVKNMMKKHRNIKILKGDHKGKAMAINLAMKTAKGEIIVILDADTLIEKNALGRLVRPFSDEKVAAVAAVLRVRNSLKPITWFQHLDYALSTSWRHVVNKINGLCIVPGFCAFRKSSLKKIGGFRGDTAVEDYDICLHLRKSGYKIGMSSSAIAYTRVPETLSGLVRQRMRWNRGTIQTMKKHSDMFMKNDSVGLYTMPTQLYWFVHAVIYLPVVIYQMMSIYFQYFVSYGNAFSLAAVEYFAKWFTLFGTLDFIAKVSSGIYPASDVNLLAIAAFALGNIFLAYSIIKFSGFNFRSLIALVFFFPYCLLMLTVYIFSLANEFFSKDRGEKWEKSA